MALLADRPERFAINYILGHDGLTTKRWRYVGSINQIYFPSCHKCFKNLTNNIDLYVYVTRHQCCNWNYNAKNQHISQLPPDKYPTCQQKLSLIHISEPTRPY